MKKKARVSSVGVLEDVVHIKVAILDSPMMFTGHVVGICVKIDELSEETLKVLTTEGEIERMGDPGHKKTRELSEKYLGLKFEIEVPDEPDGGE